MSCRVVRVSAPSRLHFGLLSFGNPDVPQFGGAGVMLSRPRIELSISAADGLRLRGHHLERIAAFVRRWQTFYGLDTNDTNCEICLEQAPGAHVGLGLGTQLGLAVASGLNAFFHRDQPASWELAASVGRGARSAVGTHGFLQGGMIVERGKRVGEGLGRLQHRLCLPSQWRVVLLCPQRHVGLAGPSEQNAFASLPPVPADATRRLEIELCDRLLPAAQQGCFEEFSDSVYEYGRQAGQFFSDVQGGPFSTPQAARWVRQLRSLGIKGTGQSSWGPTIFAWLPDQTSAESLAGRIAQIVGSEPVTVTTAQVDNKGGEIVQTQPTAGAK